MQLTTEDTVSTATQAAYIFNMPDPSENRRRRRSPEPGQALGFQFERVYDMVGADAIVLCDARGRKLKSVGNRQLCRMLAGTTPAIYTGTAMRDIHLKGLELLRPNLDWSDIAIKPIELPNRQSLFVASVSESSFNGAGVHHAGVGVRRILGIPGPRYHSYARVISSQDRINYDLAKAMTLGFHDFNESALAADMRVPGWLKPGVSAYAKALDVMLGRADRRLVREGLQVDRPSFLDRVFRRSSSPAGDGYRIHRFALAVRRRSTGRRLGTLNVALTACERQFFVPEAPTAELLLETH